MHLSKEPAASRPLKLHVAAQTLGALTSDRVALDSDGRPRFMGAGINLLLLRSGRYRRQDLCPLDYTPPEVLLGQRCRLHLTERSW